MVLGKSSKRASLVAPNSEIAFSIFMVASFGTLPYNQTRGSPVNGEKSWSEVSPLPAYQHVIVGTAALYLADCLDVMPRLGPIDAIVTDPPYGMAFRSNHRLVKHAPICNDDTDELMIWACRVPVRHSRYIFGRWDNLSRVPHPSSVITWAKNNWSMGDLEHAHARQTEIIIFYPGPEHRFPDGRPSDFIEAARTANEYHPSEKPVALMEQIIEWTIGTVVDPFMGSGSTGLACLRRGRQFIGIESDPQHFDTAHKRLAAAYQEPTMFGHGDLPVVTPPAGFRGATGQRTAQEGSRQMELFSESRLTRADNAARDTQA